MDVLQELGLSGRRTGAFTPSGVIAFKSGVILTPRARIQVPVGAVLPATFNASGLFLILSLTVHRFNGAALFSLLSRRRKKQLSVQFTSGKVLVSKGQKSAVSLDYDVYDGRWHHFALDIRSHRVFLHTSCGQKSLHADLSSKKEEILDPEGFFLLGKLNHNSAAFEGAICQFDIYPSAEAAHNYCDHIRKHCREADTYRPVLPALLPPFPDPNITTAPPLLLTEKPKKVQTPSPVLTWENSRTKVLPPNDHLPELDETSLPPTVSPPNPAVASVPPTLHFMLEEPSKFPAETVTPSLRISVTLPNPKLNSHNRKKTEAVVTKPPKPPEQSLHSPASSRPSEMKPSQQTTPVPAPRSPSNLPPNQPTRNQPRRAAAQQPEPEVTNMLDSKPTRAATDGFQTFDLEPTQFSTLAGPPGLKGEPGPPVSDSAPTNNTMCIYDCRLHDQISVC